jgi:hypothetical protein
MYNQVTGNSLAVQQGPVYVTRRVGAAMAGVESRTFERYASPTAWRWERDGKLSPLYDLAAVEAFRVSYHQPEVAGGEM